MGAGNVFHVTVNKHDNGRLLRTSNGWRHDLNPKTILQGDDVAVIIELVEQQFLYLKNICYLYG